MATKTSKTTTETKLINDKEVIVKKTTKDDGTQDHSAGMQVGTFCTLRSVSCKHDEAHTNKDNHYELKHQYVENCRTYENENESKEIKRWVNDEEKMYAYAEGQNVGNDEEKILLKQNNAHHLITVAEITKAIAAEETTLWGVISITKWCVNNKNNMITLPMYAQTICWYFNLPDRISSDMDNAETGRPAAFALDAVTDKLDQLKAKVKNQKIPPAPPFQKRPQHDIDHNGNAASKCRNYNAWINAQLSDIFKNISRKKDDHDIEAEKLKNELNKLSIKGRNTLKRYGKRTGGTHKAWESAMKYKSWNNISEVPQENILTANVTKSTWYAPFSMAEIPGKRTFPLYGDYKGEMSEAARLRRLIYAFSRI